MTLASLGSGRVFFDGICLPSSNRFLDERVELHNVDLTLLEPTQQRRRHSAHGFNLLQFQIFPLSR